MKKYFNIKILIISVFAFICFFMINEKVEAKNYECTYTASSSNFGVTLSENSYSLVRNAKGSELNDNDKKGYMETKSQRNMFEIVYDDSGNVKLTGVPKIDTKISTNSNSLSLSNTFSQSFSMNFSSSDFVSKYKDGKCPNNIYTNGIVDLVNKNISYSVSLSHNSYYSNSYKNIDISKYKVNADDENERPTGCARFGSLEKYIYAIYNLIRFGVPIVIVLLSTLDFASVVISGENDNMEKAKKKFITRLIIGVIIFLIPIILQAILKMAGIIPKNDSLYDLICFKK